MDGSAFRPILAAFAFVWTLAPSKDWWKRPHLNFITVHYIYMIGMTILGSLILFAGGMPYIDAIFFSGGAATQSGLNTIDVNLILIYQQVVLMLWACITTPVFINTFVVFVRLYWFERRFKHIVEDQRLLRRTRSRSRVRPEAKELPDPGKLEGGVQGRQIRVLHETTTPNGMSGEKNADAHHSRDFAGAIDLAELSKKVESEQGSSSSDGKNNEEAIIIDGDDDDDDEKTTSHDHAATPPQEPESPHYLGLNPRTITFPKNLPTPAHKQEGDAEHPTEQKDMSRHIAFVRRQQNSARAGSGTLRIPGPRDFDRGELPKEVNQNDHALTPLSRLPTTESTEINRTAKLKLNSSRKSEDINADDHPVRRAITIDEPEHHPRHPRPSEDSANDDKSLKSMSRRIMAPLRRRRRAATGTESNLGDRKSTFARTMTNLSAVLSRANDVEGAMPYLSWEATIGRNSAFVGLTAAQREELGGIEYRSLKTLAAILICYFVGFHVLGMMVYLPWIIYTQPWNGVVASDGVNPAWWGVFTPASMFNDLGLTLTPDSMISFQQATVVLLLGSFLIVIGNTGFPIMLRFIIWVLAKLTVRGTPLWEELRFLLDHPRRCFTLLFPSAANWWLFWILILLNVIDLILFIILDLNDPTVTDMPPGYRVLNGWFQATSTRTAGFSSVNLSQLHPAIQVSYMIMMYISVLPIAISVRRTNVYEEKSLGLWGGEEQADMENPSYVGQHLRRQLSFDLWYIFLGFFIICIVESERLAAMDDPAFSMFAVLFEIVSAYGTVGLSLGYPTINASLSAEFHTLSKLVIIAMMIRGRHRGLPYALDRAILLPSEKQYEKEAEDADRRFDRRGSIFAESQFTRSKTWEQGELDENGLPKQHSAVDDFDPMTSGAGGDRRAPRLDRRGSAVSSASQPVPGAPTQQRGRQHQRRLTDLIASGLSAGPTWSKHD